MWYCLGIMKGTRRKRSSLDELIVLDFIGDRFVFHMIRVVLSGHD